MYVYWRTCVLFLIEIYCVCFRRKNGHKKESGEVGDGERGKEREREKRVKEKRERERGDTPTQLGVELERMYGAEKSEIFCLESITCR